MQTPNYEAECARDQASADDDIDHFREAAWYAVVPFINPLDCSRRTVFTSTNGTICKPAIPLNYNEKLNAFYNGETFEGSPAKPTWFSKKRMANHLSGRDTYFYRSRPNGFWRDGYGSHPNAIKKLGDAAELLGIDRKCRPYPWVGVLLLCADIDCHNGEKDVAAVRDWLLKAYFPSAYWEPSTGGDGVHLYVKVAYRPWLLKDRDTTLRHVVGTINHVAALLDNERLQIGYDAPVDKLRGLPSQFTERNGRVLIQRSECIKIPRFKNGLQDVREFHSAPFFLFDHFERLSRDGVAQPPTSVSDSDGLVDAAIGWDIDERSADKPRNRDRGAIAHNSVYPSYTDYLDDLRQQQDAFARTMGLALAFSRHIRRVPSVNEAVAEYEAQGLATGADVNGARHNRFEYVLPHVAKTFKPSIDLTSGFQNAQEALIAEIRAKMPTDHDLTYAKAQGRRESVGFRDIAAVLHAMRTSQRGEGQTAFSQAQMMSAIKTATGKSCCKNKASSITKALLATGLIERVAGYIPGVRGFVYRVSRAA